MRRFLVSVSLVFSVVADLTAQSSVFPDSVGQRMRYDAVIETAKAYVGGVCLMVNMGDEVVGSLFNEFGISTLSFAYSPQTQKVKLLGVTEVFDKWYVRKTLRKDLPRLFCAMHGGVTEYVNSRKNIKYKFIKLKDSAPK